MAAKQLYQGVVFHELSLSCRHNGSKADKPVDTTLPQYPHQQGPSLAGAG